MEPEIIRLDAAPAMTGMELMELTRKELSRLGSNISTSSIESYNRDVHVFNAWNTEPITSSEMAVVRVCEFIEANKKRKRPSTLRRMKQGLKKALITTYRELSGGQNRFRLDAQFRALRIPKGNVRISSSEFLSHDEMNKLVAGAGSKAQMFIRFLYNTGARVSEMLHVKLSDCKSHKNQVFISVVGKGNRVRELKIGKAQFDEIRKYFAGSMYLFENKKTKSKTFTRQYVHILIKKCEKILGRRLHCHTFRHSLASELAVRNESINAIAELLGHASPVTTARFYLHNAINNKTLNEVWV